MLLKLVIRADASAQHSEVTTTRTVPECVCVGVCAVGHLLAIHLHVFLNVSSAQFHSIFKPAC